MTERPPSIHRMRRLILLAAWAWIAVGARAQRPASPTTLAALRSNFRPLLLFAAKPNSPQLLIELRNLRDASSSLAARNVLVLAVPYNAPAPTTMALTPAEALQARRRFRIAPADFTILLLGKDGEEKLRSHKSLTIEQLDRLIDALPTRQQETQPHPTH
jgi:Domain of unknown function (DUF4174)